MFRLSGYITAEKLEIATRYLIPKALAKHGIAVGQLRIEPEALTRVIESYAREAGVRNLENLIRKILRKAAMKLAADPAQEIAVGPGELEAFLGKPVFAADELFDAAPGIVTGLAWTSLGGATLQVEATAVRAKGRGFKQTGQLGNVMIESSDIAYSYAMAHAAELGARRDFFDRHFIHLHVPAGSTPKDGPSAGITMATALISLATGRRVRPRLAMTGELTLTGHVLPIGGVKEKVIAARRAGCKLLVLPEGNRKDFEELPAHLRDGLAVTFARTYREVHAAAFRRTRS